VSSFAESVKRNIQRVLTEVDTKCTLIAKDLFTTVVDKSPTKPGANYAQGHFINNWYTGINSYSQETSSATSYEGMASRQRIGSLPSGVFFGKDGFVSFSNSLPYVRNVEYDGWMPSENPRWSGKVGPYAPVGKSLVQVAAK